MSVIPHQLDLICPAQAHEDKNWRGNFRHEYALQVGVPVTSLPVDKAGRVIVLELDVTCTHANYAAGPKLQPRVRCAPSIALLIKSLREPIYPGDDEVFHWRITHVAQVGPMYMQRFGEQPEQVVGTVWAPTMTPKVSTYQQQHNLPAAQFRLCHFFVKLNEESRLKLSIWLDAMYEEGVLQ